MRHRLTGFLSLVVAFACVASARADLKVDDPMPALKVGQVFNNQYGVDLSDLKGYVTVVEFWATWCGPCRASIPHLNALHERYKDKNVVFVGLSDEPTDLVERFMTNQIKMDYLVAAESKSNRDFGVQGIPTAFIVDPSGIVRWIGHPLNGLDEALDSVLRKYPPSRQLVGGPEFNGRMLLRSEAAFKHGNLPLAAENLRRVDVKSLGADEEQKARYDALTQRINTALQAEFDRAMVDVNAKRYSEGLAALKRLSTAFAGSPIADKAKTEIRRLEAMPEVRSAQRNNILESYADNSLKRAQALLSAGNKADAYLKLKLIVDKYPGTAAATEASRLVTELEADTAFMDSLDNGG